MSRKPITIVLADDQSEVRQALRRYLDKDGRFWIVGEASDGAQALNKVQLLKPEAVILDLAMPNLDGMQALPKIKDASPRTKVFVLSSMVPFSDFREQAIALGATEAYDKYVPPNEIIDRIVETRGASSDDEESRLS